MSDQVLEEQRARARERNRRYRAQHPDRIREARRRWQQNNPEKVREANRRARARDPEKYRAQVRRHRLRNKQFIDEAKSVPCADCGGTFPLACMDFDHNGNEKLADISRMHNYGQEKLLAEIAKCDVVCANCHRIRHHHGR